MNFSENRKINTNVKKNYLKIIFSYLDYVNFDFFSSSVFTDLVINYWKNQIRLDNLIMRMTKSGRKVATNLAAH